MDGLIESISAIFHHPKYGIGLSLMAGFIVTTIFLGIVRKLWDRFRG
ncbi:MAG: hypothetical protein ACE5EI_07100 [Thermodesulfobacteriota bacterium]